MEVLNSLEIRCNHFGVSMACGVFDKGPLPPLYMVEIIAANHFFYALIDSHKMPMENKALMMRCLEAAATFDLAKKKGAYAGVERVNYIAVAVAYESGAGDKLIGKFPRMTA